MALGFQSGAFQSPGFQQQGATASTGGIGPIQRVTDHKRPRREIDRNTLRQMLEAAFADAPRDPVIVAAKREHPSAGPVERGTPRVDWSSLLHDLTDCLAVLDRYASRIESGRTRTRRGEKDRDELRYSADTVHDMVAALREQRRIARRRRAIALLLN